MDFIECKKHIYKDIDINNFEYYEAYEKHIFTYQSLMYFYMKDVIHLSFEDNQILVDDLNAYSSFEWDVIKKIIASSKSSTVTFDPLYKLYDFTKEDEDGNFRYLVSEYENTFRPETFKFYANFRSKGFIVANINRYIESNFPDETSKSFSIEGETKEKESSMNLFDWLKDIVKISKSRVKVCIAVKYNSHIANVSKIIEDNGFSYINITNDLLKKGNGKYVSLMKYLLSVNPDRKHENDIYSKFNIDGEINKKEILKYKIGLSEDIFNCFEDYNARLIFNFLLVETQSDTLRDALIEYLNNPDAYKYFDTHYYKDIFVPNVNLYISTFHKLKQIKEFDYVVFPQNYYYQIQNGSDSILEENYFIYAALIDRLTHRAIILNMSGESHRHKEALQNMKVAQN